MSDNNSTTKAVVEKVISDSSKEVNLKYDGDQWKSVEKRLNKLDLQILDVLWSVDDSETIKVEKEVLKCIGNNLYLYIREHLEKFDESKIIEPIVSVKKKKKEVIKKAEQMRIDNSKKLIKNEVFSMIDNLNKECMYASELFNDERLEVRGIGFLYCLWYLKNNHSNLNFNDSNNYLKFVLNVLISCERFLNSCSDYEGKSVTQSGSLQKISDILINDIREKYNECRLLYPYDGFLIHDYVPELLVITDYDKFIPNNGIQLRKNQKEVINFVKTNFEKGFLLSYHAMIASGKTISFVGLLKIMLNKRLSNKKYKNLQYIFCCNLSSVKNQIAQYCWNKNVPFAIGYKDNKGLLTITNNYNCKSDSERLVIICSPDAACMILTDHSEDIEKGDINDRYMLFLDEPTIGADIKNSRVLNENVKVMENLPKWSILSSATMPDFNDISPIIDNYKNKNSESVIGIVYSDQITIGCDVKTFDNQLVVPHLNCTTSTQLKKIIKTIKKNPFLGRIYTQKIVRILYEKCIENNISGVDDIPELFKNIDNLNADKIRQFSMNLLDNISDQDDEIISNICSTNIFDNKSDNKSDNNSNNESDNESDNESNDDLIFESDNEEDIIEEDNKENINFEKLGTSESHKFLNMNLIATLDPIGDSFKFFSDILKYLKKKDIKVKDILSNHRKDKEKHKAELEKLEKKQDIDMKKKKREDLNEKLNRDIRDKKIDEHLNSSPLLQFPKYGQINTKHHIKKFGKINKISSDHFIRNEMCLEDIPFEIMNVSDVLPKSVCVPLWR